MERCVALGLKKILMTSELIETLLGRSWALLGGSWALLGAPGSPLGDFVSIFDPPRVEFGSIFGPRGSILSLWGSILHTPSIQEGALAPLRFWGSGLQSSRGPGLQGFSSWKLDSGIRANPRLQGSSALASGSWIPELRTSGGGFSPSGILGLWVSELQGLRLHSFSI